MSYCRTAHRWVTAAKEQTSRARWVVVQEAESGVSISAHVLGSTCLYVSVLHKYIGYLIVSGCWKERLLLPTGNEHN